MGEPATQNSNPWRKGMLVKEFDEVWRSKPAVAWQPISMNEAGSLVTAAMDNLLDRMKERGSPTRKQADRLEHLVRAVQTAVIRTLRAAAPHATYTHEHGWLPRTYPELDVNFTPAEVATAIRSALVEVDAALELNDPPQQYPITESGRLMELLQALLRADVLHDADMALATASRIRGYLGGEGVEVVDTNHAGDRRSMNSFEFENEIHRVHGGGKVTLPALVEKGSGRVIREGRVQASPGDTDPEINGMPKPKEQSR